MPHVLVSNFEISAPKFCTFVCLSDIYADSESDSFQAQDDRLLDRLKTAMTPPLAECVNCDAKIARVEAIFCHTCDQVLCESCRKLVHASKMFASHKIGPITRETENERICSEFLSKTRSSSYAIV